MRKVNWKKAVVCAVLAMSVCSFAACSANQGENRSETTPRTATSAQEGSQKESQSAKRKKRAIDLTKTASDAVNMDGWELYMPLAHWTKTQVDIEQLLSWEKMAEFEVSHVGDTSIELTWKDASSADGYIIMQYDADDDTWNEIAKTAENPCTLDNLEMGTDYRFRIQGYWDADGKENKSVGCLELSQTTKLGAVSGFQAGKVDTNTIQLKWDALENADGYLVYQYDESGQTWKQIAQTGKDETSYTVEKLTSGGTYKFAVRGRQTVDGQESLSTSYAELSQSTKVKGNHTLASGEVLPVYDVQTSEPKIALTFDSAWGADDLDQILQILAKYNVPACFFCTGGFVDQHPDAVQKMLDYGHIIGNHGNTHANMSTLSNSQKYSEIHDLHEKVKQKFGVEMKYFRPPSGDYDNGTIIEALNQNYMPVQWSVDSLDWMNYGVQSIIDRTVNGSAMRNGAIILMHNGTTYTAQALEQVIVQLMGKGYQFVSLDNLVLDSNYYLNIAGTQIPY